MLALCAYYEGKVVGDQDRFFGHVETVHLPLVARYPRIQALRYLKGISRDGVAPRYCLGFELFFDSQEDLDAALASEVRHRARADVDNFAPLFEGEIHHCLYEVRDIPVEGVVVKVAS